MTVEQVQTKREIQTLLLDAGLKPRKRFGQHFLIDGNLMRRMVEQADVLPEDVVLEVGGGTGGLTDLLVRRAKHVICVEIDRDLQSLLEGRFRNTPNFTLVRGDVLAKKDTLSPEITDLLGKQHCRRVMLVANLPYQVAAPLIIDLLLKHPVVRRFCYTVQAEVGQRLTAHPGCRDFGPVGVISQLLCEIKAVARVPRQAFWPQPNVDSVILRMDVREKAPCTHDELRGLAQLLRKTFDHRRKTLRRALDYVLDADRVERLCRLVDCARRPEAFSAEEWVMLYRASVR